MSKQWLVRRVVSHVMYVQADTRAEAERMADEAPDTDTKSNWTFESEEIEARLE